MLRRTLTVAGFFFSIVLLGMALIMVCAINLVVNGYHKECGIWQNAVPFACSPQKEKPASFKPRNADAPRQRVAPKPSTRSVKAAAPKAETKPSKANPYTGRPEWGCGKLQQQPYRVQCDPETGHCYHDLGLRAECGLAHDWNVPE